MSSRDVAASALLAAFGIAGFTASVLASCAQTPVNVPVQTFEQPQNMDVVCMRVLDANGSPIVPAIPQPQAACAQVPVNVAGSTLPFHLFALVTQTTRGELAVVDLTSQAVDDIDQGTPGINFLPVGRLPTDVRSRRRPDGLLRRSAAPNAPAPGLPTTIMLGDAQGPAADGGTGLIPDLTTWPVCALPQAPGAIRVLPSSLLPRSADGGAPLPSSAGYVIVAVLPGDTNNSAKVVTIDPAPLLRGASPYLKTPGLGDGGVIPPGSLAPCPILQYLPLAAPPQGTTGAAGPAWDDGVEYVDGGVVGDVPQSGVACAAVSDSGAIGSGGSSPLFVGAVSAPVGGAAALDVSGPRPIFYVADVALPLIHVIDLSDPTAPQELAPLLATSLADPTGSVSVGQIAVSPTTRDYKRFLYAIDRKQGGILVFDVTDPVGGPRVPLTRPHTERQPL